jgi:hypothetical protein
MCFNKHTDRIKYRRYNNCDYEYNFVSKLTFIGIGSDQRHIFGGKGQLSPPESVFKELIICEIHFSNFFNVCNFITKSNYTWL